MLRQRYGLSWWRFLKDLYRRYEDHALADNAATLGYYFVFSLFPFLFFLATTLALVPHVQASVDTLLKYSRPFLPSQVMGIIEPHLRGLVAHSRPHLLALGLAAALYTASRGVNALRTALNRAYDVKESRPLWKTELIAFGMTIGGGLVLLVGVTVLVSGGSVGQWAANRLHVASEYVTVLRWIRWPIVMVAIMLAAGVSYFLLPDVKQKFRFITPGSVVGTAVWVLASWSLGLYVAHVSSYNFAYGSIGGVIVLLSWFYLTGFILLMGGEVNALLEDASPDGKRSGARAPGQTPPPTDERPSAMPMSVVDSASVAERSPGGKSSSV